MSTISHRETVFSVEETAASVTRRLIQAYSGNELELRLAIVNELCSFELGRFLLCNQGLNGYWTDYVIHNNIYSKSPDKKCSLESFILKKAPLSLATQDRNKTFIRTMQANLKNDFKLCSLPCGLMRDVFSLNFEGFEGIEVTGIDLDLGSLYLAEKLAAEYCAEKIKTSFINKDAWDLLNNAS